MISKQQRNFLGCFISFIVYLLWSYYFPRMVLLSTNANSGLYMSAGSMSLASCYAVGGDINAYAISRTQVGITGAAEEAFYAIFCYLFVIFLGQYAAVFARTFSDELDRRTAA
jgi:hypothetical protein